MKSILDYRKELDESKVTSEDLFAESLEKAEVLYHSTYDLIASL